MSLRFRLILSVGIVLLLSLGIGGALAWLNAGRSVATELDAALDVGRQTVANGITLIPDDARRNADLIALVRTFDGDRHVRAALLSGDVNPTARSSLAPPAHPAPDWFAAMIGGDTHAVLIPLPGITAATAIRLESDPANEVSEVWRGFGDTLRVLILFGALAVPIIYWSLGRALRPLLRLTSALADVGETTPVRVPESGPPELVRLAAGFNAMVERLAAAETRNRRLNEQLQTIQEEERAELARDLHDDVGPYLFAIGVDAAAIGTAATAAGHCEIAEQVASIRESVTHVQRQVRAILGRLRPGGLPELGLSSAIANLAAFWSSRHPEVTIRVDVECGDGGFGDAADAAIYRIVQESLSNAIRHGNPRTVDVVVAPAPEGRVAVEIRDDGSGLPPPGAAGFGLRGMSERVEALGGGLAVRNRRDGPGVVVGAKLPAAVGQTAPA